MSVNSYLNSLSSNMVLKDDEKDKIKTSITTLVSRLNHYFESNLKDAFIFGSYDRGTILPREYDDKSDIDVMVVLDYDDQAKPQTYLNRVRKFVEQYYSTSEIHQSNPTIVLKLTHIKFELVPAKQSGINVFSNSYQIPAPTNNYQDWLTTYPSTIADSLSKKNKDNNYYIKPIIRLLKYWNVLNYRVYSSYEIELMAIDCYYYNGTNIFDYFSRLVSIMKTNNLSSYSKEKVDKLRIQITNIISNLNNNMPYTAESEVKKIFKE